MRTTMMKFSNSCDGQPSTFSTSENCFAQARCAAPAVSLHSARIGWSFSG